MTSCLGDPVHAALPALGRLDDAVGTLADADPVEVIRIGMAAEYVGRLEHCRPALRRLVDGGRDGEHLTLTIHAMGLLSRHCYETGEWDRLARLAEEGLRLSNRYGYRLLAQTFCHRQALLAATRGDTDPRGRPVPNSSPRRRRSRGWGRRPGPNAHGANCARRASPRTEPARHPIPACPPSSTRSPASPPPE
ncbi:hypothetical protein [Embleya sp. NPDC001921]